MKGPLRKTNILLVGPVDTRQRIEPIANPLDSRIVRGEVKERLEVFSRLFDPTATIRRQSQIVARDGIGRIQRHEPPQGVPGALCHCL